MCTWPWAQLQSLSVLHHSQPDAWVPRAPPRLRTGPGAEMGVPSSIWGRGELAAGRQRAGWGAGWGAAIPVLWQPGWVPPALAPPRDTVTSQQSPVPSHWLGESPNKSKVSAGESNRGGNLGEAFGIMAWELQRHPGPCLSGQGQATSWEHGLLEGAALAKPAILAARCPAAPALGTAECPSWGQEVMVPQ